MAYRLGISRKPPLPDAYSVVLGTGDVSPLDMTHAYDNPGRHRACATIPRRMRRSRASQPATSRSTGEARPGRRVIKDGAAYEVSKILEHNAQYGTGAASQLLPLRPHRGRQDRDHHEQRWTPWFCGYSTTLIGLRVGGLPGRRRSRWAREVWGG